MTDFDPIYSMVSAKAIKGLIESNYALAGLASCSLLQRGLNDVYLVSSTSGERYVFRLSHHRVRGPADVKSETDFLIHVSKFGVPVATPIPTIGCELFLKVHAPEGRREGVLFQAVDGREPHAGDVGDAHANGRTLALLHNAAQTYIPNAPLYKLDLEHLLYRPLARIRSSGVIEDPSVLDELEQIAERTGAAIKLSANLSWTYCHGDCHGFNSKITEAGEAVFFDFDDGGPGYLAYDLAVFLWAQVSFGRETTRAWTSFLDGYRLIRPITSDDFEAALRFVVIRHVWLMGEHASRVDEWGSNNVRWVSRGLGFVRAWESEYLMGRLF
ncbi:phosphotransferase [Agrobacterium sp. CNPSo 3708]|uniref:phosphotransferase enzyme family protein n=1 Tax=Agrobacterium sp. CNPSo 3708 TaxID=3028150 RepID=UPI002363BDEA|nr:phosphotransferase [Agrobacterium sp. CNPSo 3708]MDD1499292.1 phosphotransferase [Agrobacterium sp. CNPSo 3708]